MSGKVARKPPARRAATRLDVLIVINPMASRTTSTDARGLLAEALSARGLQHRFVETTPRGESPRGFERAIQRALESGCRRVVAVGGDGTVSLTAAQLTRRKRRGARPTLAIIPTGTANVLARELGIPLALPTAVALALEGDRTIELDAISTKDRPVFTQVGIGLDAQMIRHTSREKRVRSGRLAYAMTFARRAFVHRPVVFQLEIDGQRMHLRALQIVVANVGALGAPPFTWGPGIDPSDGVIDVCIFTARTLRDHIRLVLSLLTADHGRDSRTRYFHAVNRVVISSRRPMLVQGDGEILGRTPITLGVIPRAVRVCVPKDIEGLESTVGSPTDLASVLDASKSPAASGNGSIAAGEAARGDDSSGTNGSGQPSDARKPHPASTVKGASEAHAESTVTGESKSHPTSALTDAGIAPDVRARAEPGESIDAKHEAEPLAAGKAGEPIDASKASETLAATKASETLPVAEPAETLSQDVRSMVAQHSRTWVLQGWPRHPVAFVSALDAALYMRINALQFGTMGDRGMILVSKWMHHGEGWAVVAIIMLAVDFGTGLRTMAEALPVLWATMLIVNFPLKQVFRRRRPFIAFVKARVRGPKPLDSSFPSGHTASAFAGALLFGAHAPMWSPLFYALATLVGFSRIYLGVHYPSDVLMGAAIGSGLAAAILALVRLALASWM